MGAHLQYLSRFLQIFPCGELCLFVGCHATTDGGVWQYFQGTHTLSYLSEIRKIQKVEIHVALMDRDRGCGSVNQIPVSYH